MLHLADSLRTGPENLENDMDYNAKNPAPGVRVYGCPIQPFPKGITMAQVHHWRKTGETPIGLKDRLIRPGPRSHKPKPPTRSLTHLCGPGLKSNADQRCKTLLKEVSRLKKWHRRHAGKGLPQERDYLAQKARFKHECGTLFSSLVTLIP